MLVDKTVYKNNKGWLKVDEIKSFSDDPEMLDKWYDEYKKLKGKHNKEKFAKNLAVFFKITCDIYTGGDPVKDMDNIELGEWASRQEAYECWSGYINSYNEAKRYFEAVDNVTSYS